MRTHVFLLSGLLLCSLTAALLLGFTGHPFLGLPSVFWALFFGWRLYVQLQFMRHVRLCDRLAARLFWLNEQGQLAARMCEAEALLDQHSAALRDACKWARR